MGDSKGGEAMNTIEPQIAFIGAGNMASALIGGMIAHGTPAQHITVMSPTIGPKHPICQQFAVRSTQDIPTAIEHADVLIIAVKPQQIEAVALGMRKQIQRRKPLVISIAAGVRTQTLATWIGDGIPIVRSMPNLPAKIQVGASGIYADHTVTKAERALAEQIFQSVGVVVWVEKEHDIDVVTAVSGSGPAYYFLMLEAMEDAAQHLGLSADAARLLTLQTAQGAMEMVAQTGSRPSALRTQVTSPGGTTAAAIAVFEQGTLRELFKQAMTAAYDRSKALAQ